MIAFKLKIAKHAEMEMVNLGALKYQEWLASTFDFFEFGRPLGSGWGTVVGCTTCYQDVVGSNLAGACAFFSSLSFSPSRCLCNRSHKEVQYY